VAILRVRKDVSLLREKHMSIVKVRKDIFLKEKCDVAKRRPHKHVTFLI
jgi:hypothetical protein